MNDTQNFYITTIALNSLDIPKNVLVQKTRSGAIKVLARKVGTRPFAEKIVNYSFDKLFESGAIVLRSGDLLPPKVRDMYPQIFKNPHKEQSKSTPPTNENQIVSDESSEKSI